MLSNEPSLIVVIKRKELELSDRLEAARRAAEAALQAERQYVADARALAEQEGRAEAEKFYRDQLAEAEAEAAQIAAGGERSAARIAERGQHRMPEAVETILAVVLPPVAPALGLSSDAAARAAGAPGNGQVTSTSPATRPALAGYEKSAG